MALDFSKFGTPVQPEKSLPDFSGFGTPVEASASTVVAPEVQAERDRESLAYLEAERKKNLDTGDFAAADANAREIARRQKTTAAAPAKPASPFTPEKPKEESGFLRQAADIPLSLAKGFTQGVRMVADVFGAGSTVSKTIKGAEDYLGGLMSAQAKNDQQEIARIMKEAEDKGVADQVKAGLQAFMQAPADLVVQGLGTTGPVILAALGSKLLGGGALALRATSLLTGAGMGAGTVKGTIYEETKKALLEAKVPEAQAEARAQLAQSYGGKNLDMILAGTALGGLTATTGIEKPLIDATVKRILGKTAATEAAKATAKETAETAAKKSLPRRVITGATTEAVPEIAQAGQEKLAENIALQREGFDVPTTRGVVGAATLEGMVGAGLGAGVGAVSGRPSVEEERPVPPPPADTIDARAAQIAADLQAVGFPEAEAQTIAKSMAEDELARTQEKAAVKGEEALTAPPADRLEAKVQEFIDAGVAPDEARLRAESAIAEEDEADALARAEEKGAADVAGTVEGAGRTGVSVAEQPSGELPTAEGVAGAERGRVDVIGPDVAGAVERKGTEPVAVTEGEKVGTETAEAVQTEAQRQEAPAAPAVAEAPKKRGRPALTEEQKAARQPAQKEAKAAAKKADASIKKLNDLLDTKVDPDNFANDQAFEEAQTELNNKRGAALREVLMLEPTMQRGSAASKRLKAAIERPEISKQQLELVRKGVELSRKAPSRAEAAAAAPAREDFKANTNGVQSLGTIIKGKASPVFKAIAQRLRAANAGVKFQVIEKGDSLPPVLERNKTDWNAARGLFIQNDATGERSIYVKGSSYGEDQGANDVTVLHENLHAATNQKLYLGIRALQRGFSTDSKLARATQDLIDLMRRTGEEMTRLDKRKQLPPAVGRLFEATNGKIVGDPREFLAYGMSDPDFQNFLMTLEGVEEESFFTRFVDVVRRLLGMPEDATNALTDLIVVTDKILSARKTPTMYFLERAEKQAAQKAEGEKEKVSAAKAKPPGPRTEKEIEKEVAVAKEKVRISEEGDVGKLAERLQKARNAGDVLDILKGAWDSMSAAQREATVRLPTFDFLGRWTKEDVPRIAETNRLLQEMNGMSMKFLEGAEQITSTVRRAFQDDPALRPKLTRLIYTSTLARVDPANPDATERSKQLDADYAALGESGQKLYVMLRDYYKAVNDLYRNLLDQQIENMSGIAPEVKQNILAKIKQAYETGERIEPFFPLVRRGDFWLATGSGKTRQFYMYETRGERDAAARKLAAERRVSVEEMLEDRKLEVGNNVGELRRYSLTGNSSAMLTSIFDAIDSQDMGSPDAREGLKDAIYQIYLQTMPEQSFRSMFIHRKGRAGFSTDLLRNTATTASKMAVQLSRLKYAPMLRNTMSAAKDSIAERPEFLPFVDEANRRVDLALSGQEGGISEAVAGAANKLSYVWYLSSASSALIQPFSVFITGLPIIGANHGSMAGAAKEISKAVGLINQYGVTRKNVDGTTSWSAPSLANNTSLPADERRAIKEMTNRGVQESTYASLVWEYKRTPSADLDSLTEKGKRLGDVLIGGLMHNTERLTREAVYLASYRMGRNRGLSFEEAVDQAVSDTNEALADYDISNRPRWMQQGLGRIAFQFKMYPLHMILLMLTNFKRMLPLLNKEGKAEAAKKFFGIIGTTGMLAGVSGLPMFSAVMGTASWAMKQMADDDELPEEFKDKDLESWFRFVFLPEKLGDMKIGGVPVSDILDRGVLNALTGWDIASRIGLNDIWFRDAKEERTAREAAIAFFLDNFGGPITSITLSWVDAYEAFMLGDYQKAMERALPAVARNLVIANKYSEEGVKNARGAELIPKDEVTAGMKFGQSVGFRPDKIATAQAAAYKTTAAEQKVIYERDRLMKMVNIAHSKAEKTEDYASYDKLLDGPVATFNAKNPEYAIDADSLYNSLFKRIETRESARAGINITEKNARLKSDVADYAEKMLKPAEEKK